MPRICNGKLWLDYEPCFEHVKFGNDVQDRMFGSRLSKGLTYLIGMSHDNKRKFYMTIYDSDGSVELWSRRESRSGFVEESHSFMSEYEFYSGIKIREAH